MSTRGGAPAVGFAEAMIEGLAPDGGLYVPERFPEVPAATLASWAGLSYPDLATAVLALLAPEMDEAGLRHACSAAYGDTVFATPEVVTLRPLVDDCWLLGLSHGPSLAFKDMAMQLLGRLFDAELGRRGRRLLVVGATSGDTGSSAEYAMIGSERIGVVMLSPWGKVSPFQAAQMYSLDEPNILNIAVKGVFDDAQDLVKAVNRDADFKARHAIGAVNSINWARVAAQIVYYVWAYLQLAPALDREVQVAVPTGNFGNIYAGILARRLGLPLRLILATNENDVLDEFFRTGTYRVRSSAEVAETSSPSMDIARASNFERFVWDLLGGDGDRVAALWSDLAESGRFDLSRLPGFAELARWIESGSSTHADRLATIGRTAVEDGVVVDPHTADGLGVGRRLRDREVPLVCLETALPAKFAATIVEALGQQPPRPDRFAGLEERPQHVTVLDPDLAAVRTEIAAFSAGLAD